MYMAANYLFHHWKYL